MKRLRIYSWNVNGLRSAMNKGFLGFMQKEKPDIVCIQETKAHRDQVVIDLPDYEEYWNSAVQKGHAGTAIFTKVKTLSVRENLPIDSSSRKELQDSFGDGNQEGRVLTLEFEEFFLVNVYTPNSKRGLERLEYRYKYWDPLFLKYIQKLEKGKPVVFCGDLNVAHTPIDLARPKGNESNHGFTKVEREGFDNILNAGYVDIFRSLHLDEPGHYTWWSPFAKSRERNVGWRIDYFIVSKSLRSNIRDTFILPEVVGSDHCPIGIVIEWSD